MKFALLFCTLLFAGAIASSNITCDTIIQHSGLSSIWNETIAHAIHSMTTEGLDLFKVNHKVKIPTVNQNLEADEKVVEFAPDVQLGADFTTSSMNEIDRILSILGTSDDGLGSHWSPLERVVHSLHMTDLWLSIKNVYDASTSPDDKVCKCLIQESSPYGKIYQAVEWIAQHYRSGTPISLMKREHNIPALTDHNSWAIWKEDLLRYYGASHMTDAAAYLHCLARL